MRVIEKTASTEKTEERRQSEGSEKGETRDRILDAAESLFAERGFSGSGLRAITDRAGANVAAVNYHFGSKAELLDAVIRRAFDYILGRQGRLLDEVEGSEDITARRLVETMVQPFVELSEGDRVRVQTIARLIGRLLASRDREALRDYADVHDLEGRYVGAFRRFVPEVGEEEMLWRYDSCMGLIINDQTSPTSRSRNSISVESQRERLVNLVLAAITSEPQ